MAYTDVFGGETIFPSLTSYLSIMTAIDVTLQWPREQQIAGIDVVADWMDVDTSVAALNIDMPSASATSTGNKALFSNIGANTFTVRDSTGGTIQSVAPGEQWILVLSDNTTAAGTWVTSQLGATVSVASASALAGAGIKAITTTLNQQIDSDVEGATPFTVVDGDRAKCLIYTAGAGTCNLPSPGAVANDWFFMLRNSGSGTLNVVPPSGLIDGSASINMDTNDAAFIFTDGTDFFTIGFGQGNTLAFDYVSLAVPGSGDFVLSGANLDRVSYNFTGALTGNRRIVVPNTVQQYWVDNQTTGAFTLEIDTAAGAGQLIPQGQSLIVYCDGADVINATSSTSVAFPITIGQGGTNATTVGGAQTNLQVPPVGRLLIAGVGIDPAGLGDLSADRTINAFLATETQVGVREIATQAETDAGTDDVTIVTPLKLENKPGFGVVQAAVKAAGEFKSNDAAITADADLTLPVVANTRYAFEIYIQCSIASGGTGIQWSILGPASSVRPFFSLVYEDDDLTLDKVINGSGSANFTFLSFSDLVTIRISGTIEVGGTPGNVSFGWAQSVSNANATQVRENSQMTLTQLD